MASLGRRQTHEQTRALEAEKQAQAKRDYFDTARHLVRTGEFPYEYLNMFNYPPESLREWGIDPETVKELIVAGKKNAVQKHIKEIDEAIAQGKFPAISIGLARSLIVDLGGLNKAGVHRADWEYIRARTNGHPKASRTIVANLMKLG